LRQVGFIAAAIIVAVWINTFVLWWNFWKQLKSNVLESSKQRVNDTEKKADIYIQRANWEETNSMNLIAWSQMDQVKSISFWIIYNPEEVEIQDVFSRINWLKLSRLENVKGVTTLILQFANPETIPKWANIIKLYASKALKNTQHLNLIQANFTDNTGVTFDLTTSWAAF
jgi:hypothetical protein